MKPHIDSTSFGSITIDEEKYDHDVMIRLSGKVKKRKKKLSKKVYGSSHTVSLDEAEYVYKEGAKILVFGTGQNGVAKLSEEAEEFFENKGCRIIAKKTPEAVEEWNKISDNAVGLFHITC